MSSEEQAHNELFEKVGNLMATAKATQDSVALLRSDTNQGIDRISAAINAHMATTDAKIKEVSDRVAVYEGDRRMFYGIGSALVFVFTICGSWIWDGIKHWLHWA